MIDKYSSILNLIGKYYQNYSVERYISSIWNYSWHVTSIPVGGTPFQVLPLIFLESSKILISTCSHNLFNRRLQRIVLLYLCFNPIWHNRYN